MKAKEFIPSTKPRNFVAKNAPSSGAGRHKDSSKKKDQEQGNVKHKKDLVPMEGVAEGWKDEADDFSEWTDYVKEKLSKASPEQRLGLAKKLSQVEVKNFGSSLSGGFDRNTGKAKTGELTDTVKSIMRSVDKEADGSAGNFSMPFGSVDVSGLEDAPPEVLKVMKKAVMLGGDVAAAARNFYKKHGTLTDQDLPKIQQGLASAASDEWKKQGRTTEGSGSEHMDKMMNDYKDKLPAAQAVDAKGRTQQRWIQLVKAKFPDAKIMVAKMKDGPVQATLSDGRKLSWKKVDQGVAEGLDDTASATPAKNERGRFTALDDDEPMRLKCEDGEFRTIQEINMLRQKIGMKPFSIKSQQGVAEGEEDLTPNWAKYVLDQIYNSNGAVTMTDLFDEGIPGLRDMFMATAEELGLDPDEDFQDVESEVLEKLEDLVSGPNEMSERVRDPEDWDEGDTEPGNNFAVYINGKKWKVLPGPAGAYADSPEEEKEFYRLKAMAQRKSQDSGKKWEVYKTGELAT